jgi:hypothetical protein
LRGKVGLRKDLVVGFSSVDIGAAIGESIEVLAIKGKARAKPAIIDFDAVFRG